MRRTLTVLALICLLAGCSAPFATGTPDADLQGSATGTAAEFSYPEGYGPDGVTNGSRAATLHESRVDKLDRYRLVIDQTSDIGDRSGSLAFTWTQGPDATYGNYTSYNATESETTAVWKQNGTLRVSRQRVPDVGDLRSRYLTMQGDVDVLLVSGLLSDRPGYAASSLRRLNASTTSATVVRRNGTKLLRVRTTPPPSNDLPTNSTYDSYEETMWVDESGIVQRKALRVNRTVRDWTWNSSTAVRLSEVGTAAPKPPAWLDRTADVTASAEDGLLVVEHRGGPSVPFAGYTPLIGDADGHRTAPLNGSLSAGDTLFIYFSQEEGGFTAARERPDHEEYLPQSGSISFAAGNETVGVKVAAEL